LVRLVVPRILVRMAMSIVRKPSAGEG
jgi:hypothetical protein